MEVWRYRRMDTNKLNVVLEKFSFDLKVLKQLDPTVACVAGACQRYSQIILQLNGQNGQPGVSFKERYTFWYPYGSELFIASKDNVTHDQITSWIIYLNG